MNIYAFVPDLIDKSKFGSKAKFISSANQLDDLEIDLLIVDLDRCKNIKDFLKENINTIGFASHVNETLLSEAAELGFDQVLPRSVFFRRLPEILAGAQ